MANTWTWTFTLEDGNHVVGYNIDNRWVLTGILTVDGMQVNKAQGWSVTGKQVTFRIGSHVGILTVKRGFASFKPELRVDTFMLESGTHAVVVRPHQASPQFSSGRHCTNCGWPIRPGVKFCENCGTAAQQTTHPAAPAQPAGQTSTPMLPVLPSSCSKCQAPISMNSVNWTGPMSASCSHCGSNVEIKWKKIGD